uniref:tyrosine-type recombinase/integrase n=1 Tax=Candidatus Protochlamydia sp. R18 TaxID=1353977 RepID=UPI0009AD16B9|nr:tyrosine-type recombinase/integrase [Candidatus Protochlamydia sp. R18]
MKTFAKAKEAAGIPFKLTPHVLRATTVTYLKQQGFQDSDIMRVTGHASSEMVYAYDKTTLPDNASKKINLIE